MAQKSHAGLHLLQGRNESHLDEGQRRDIALAYRLAYSCMATGKGDTQLWHTLMSAVMVGQCLLERGVCIESAQIINDAEKALASMKDIYDMHGVWRVGGRQVILDSALRILDRQMEVATVGQVTTALHKVLDTVS